MAMQYLLFLNMPLGPTLLSFDCSSTLKLISSFNRSLQEQIQIYLLRHNSRGFSWSYPFTCRFLKIGLVSSFCTPTIFCLCLCCSAVGFLNHVLEFFVCNLLILLWGWVLGHADLLLTHFHIPIHGSVMPRSKSPELREQDIHGNANAKREFIASSS